MIVENMIGNYTDPTWRELVLAAVLVIAAVIVSAVMKHWRKSQRILFPFFVFYICYILGITVFYRLPYDGVRYEFGVFWSYSKAVNSRYLFWEILLNYMMLLPYGVFGCFYMKKRWVLVSGVLFSAAIEITQFIMRRGLFEFDDIIGNGLGVLIGIGIYCLIMKAWKRFEK